ncbi:hypothetical protein ABIF23_002898 [Bradyrhizobium elkanii]
MNTIECAEVMCWSASAVSSGKPITTPSATMVSDTRSLRCGQGCRSTASSAAPSNAAIAARAEVRNSGENPATATRVAGSEPLKIITPSRPLPQPSIEALSIVPHLRGASRDEVEPRTAPSPACGGGLGWGFLHEEAISM